MRLTGTPSSNIYKPLRSDDYIRVIHVHSVDRIEGIKCTMRDINLGDSPHYQCLSYTWGNPLLDSSPDTERTFQLLCNGAYLTITSNLHNALCHLWKFAKDELDGIWIDALCINQNDNKERNQQVAMMTRIYKNAQRVIVWLGPEDEDSHDIYEVLSLIVVHEETHSGFLTQLEAAESSEDIAGMELPSITPKSWFSCDMFFKRPYFRRAWIIQEVLLQFKCL